MMKMNNDKVIIDIPNWDKYQTGKKTCNEWVKVSTNMAHDPAVIELPVAARWAWVCLLLHGGRVGVPFEFSPRLGRVLFGLHHSPALALLVDQGLITLETPRREEKKIETEEKKVPKKKVKREGTRECPADFVPKMSTSISINKHNPRLTADEIREGLAQMKAHVFAKPKLDWDATYRNWMNNFRSKNGQAKQTLTGIDATRQALADDIRRLEAEADSYDEREGGESLVPPL
jgi:hypothetical protein